MKAPQSFRRSVITDQLRGRNLPEDFNTYRTAGMFFFFCSLAKQNEDFCTTLAVVYKKNI